MKEDNAFNETGIWNVATGYSFDVVMYHIYWIVRYELMAKRGALEFNQDISLTDEEKKDNRAKAVEWLYSHLSSLISNSIFAIKKTEDKEIMVKIGNDLQTFEKCIKGIRHNTFDQKNNIMMIGINEALLEKILSNLIKVKEQAFPVLYRANIVFQYKEDFTPEQMKKKFLERFTKVG